ncbi:MAG: hypothetical protein AAFZ10_04985 [Pseudomonadota bacterium]
MSWRPKIFVTEDRGAVAIEAVLILPIMLMVAAVVAELFIASQRRVAVEAAAFAAARAALVHKCPPFQVGSPFETVTSLAGSACSDKPQKWTDAARWALISSAPGSEHAVSRGQCQTIAAAQEALRAAGLRGDLTQAARNRICYAYEPGNVQVDVDWHFGAMDVAYTAGFAKTLAIKATVTYRYPTASPVRKLISDGRRSDGTHWYEKSATVVIR